jgi:transcriptional regulator with XRE-family HTH domain
MPRHDDPQIGLSKAIRQLRRETQLSQEALGLRADIHPTWISHIESGRVNPTWGNVRRIARGLQVPLPVLAALAEDLEAKHAPPQPGPDGDGRLGRAGSQIPRFPGN